MEQFLVFLVVVYILYLVSKRFAKKEVQQFMEENNEDQEALHVEQYDPATEVLVKFMFIKKNDQFMISSFPNLKIASVGNFKMINDVVVLKVPQSIQLHFGVPYMKGEAFKVNQTIHFELGKMYKVMFKPKVFIFQKPKVYVEQVTSFD